MAVFNGETLRDWRKAQKISAEDLAEALHRETRTIFRFQSGEMTPDPNEMLKICRLLGDETRWFDWMATTYESFREMVPETTKYDLPGSTLKLYAAVEELSRFRNSLFRDAADGSIDNDRLRKDLRSVTDELYSVTQALRTILMEKKGA